MSNKKNYTEEYQITSLQGDFEKQVISQIANGEIAVRAKIDLVAVGWKSEQRPIFSNRPSYYPRFG